MRCRIESHSVTQSHRENFRHAKHVNEKAENTSESEDRPEGKRLKLKGDWQALIGKALAKKRPKKGWGK